MSKLLDRSWAFARPRGMRYFVQSCLLNGSAEFSVRATMGSKCAVGRRSNNPDIFFCRSFSIVKKFMIMRASCEGHLRLIQGGLYDLHEFALACGTRRSDDGWADRQMAKGIFAG